GASTIDFDGSHYGRSKVKTFFFIGIGKGDEIADYSVAFNTTSDETKSYTKNYYNVSGTETIASALTAAQTDAELLSTETFKKNLSGASTIDFDGSHYGRSKVKTFFFIGLGKGDEIADYSVAFNTASDETKSFTKNFYNVGGAEVEASALTAAQTDAELLSTETFKKNLSGASTIDFDGSHYTRSKVKTFFFIGLGKGDEIADYSVAFNTTSDETKSYTKNYYNVSGTETIASALTAAQTDAELLSTETFKKNLSGASTIDFDGSHYTRSKVKTFFFIGLGKGDEIADYSVAFNTASDETKSFTKNFYNVGGTETIASALTAAQTDAELLSTETFKKNLSGASTIDFDGSHYGRSKVKTFFFIGLGKGDEIADYSVAFNTASDETKSFTKNFYNVGGAEVEASALTAAQTDAELLSTETFKKNLSGASTIDFDGSHYTRSKVKTFFFIGLGKGDEIADYSAAFNTASDETKSYTKNYYNVSGTETIASALTAAQTDAELLSTETFKKNLSGASTIDFDGSHYGRSKVKTFFFIGLGKGDEIADYSLAFNTTS